MNTVKPIVIEQVARHGTTVTDDALVDDVKSGNTQKFEQLMRRYNQKVFRIARSYIPDDDQAMDVVQDGYVTAYTKLDQYRGPGKFSSWLSQIVRNKALMKLRNEKKIYYLPPIDIQNAADEFEGNKSVQPSPELDMESKQLGNLVEHCIDRLSVDHRAVFMMRAIEQLSIQETAELLELPVNTVKTRFYRANQQMQQLIKRKLELDELHAFQFDGERCDLIVRLVLTRLGVTSKNGK